MSRERPVEIKALSGARAIPPLILVLFHFCEGHGYRGLPWFDLIAAKGYLWVEFFFALSGFVLVYVYGARLREMWTPAGYTSFLWARLSRLYPLHLFMMFAILAQYLVFDWFANAGGYVSIFHQPYHPILTLPTFIANLFLVQAWNLFPYLSWNGIAWFVSVEFLLCLLFPLYLTLSRGGAMSGTIALAAGVAGLVALNFSTNRYGLDLTFHNGIYRGMSAFAAGVGLATLFASSSAQMARLPAYVHSAVQLLFVALLLYAVRYEGWSHTHRDILTVLPMLGLVGVLASDKGVVASALKSRVTLKLGEWSYGIFIGQTFWLQFDRFAEQRIFPLPQTIVLGMTWQNLIWWLEPAALVLVCIAWGALLTMVIERPANAALRKLYPRRAIAAAPA
jgi:peptidoglycan/LPS O-acetylase OafA/YrhL